MKQRVISAAVLVPIVLLMVGLSVYTRVLLILVVGIACAYELSINLEKQGVYCSLYIMVLYLVAQAAVCLLGLGLTASCVCFAACVYLALLSGITRTKVSGSGAMDTTSGLAYPCMMFGILMVVCVSDIWLEALALGCVTSWICDAFALFGGKWFGKHKVAPLVSPKKTVEGCITGAIFGTASGALLWAIGLLLQNTLWSGKEYILLPIWVCLLTAFCASTMGQFGDLAESLIKRMLNVKDFSNLIPGHGGMFDRADSLLFSIPTAYICLRLYLYLAG